MTHLKHVPPAALLVTLLTHCGAQLAPKEALRQDAPARARTAPALLPVSAHEFRRHPLDTVTMPEAICSAVPSLLEGSGVCGRAHGGIALFSPSHDARAVAAPEGLTRGDPDEFTLAVLPDTQYYSQRFPETLLAQVRFLTQNREALGIRAVIELGDLVHEGSSEKEWENADLALRLLEADGIPFGVAVGNHDQTPRHDPAGTSLYNKWFGVRRFEGRRYYGGHFGSDNDNSWFTFGSGQHPFLVLLFEYADDMKKEVIAWARSVMRSHPRHTVIVASHYLIDSEAKWGEQGRRIYEGLREEPNLTLLLCGHIVTEARRTDPKTGGVVHTLLSDYQDRENGGDGWLRLLRFFPNRREISVFTYSPKLEAWEVDESSHFDLSY